ncbi:MAG TPA: PKD domain-containing protein [Puia sp.]|nr:PKD domain-containing protein [Puia sp.]
MRTFYPMFKLLIITALCSLFQVKSSIAQVQTARAGVTINANCHGFYEYLPQGYSTGTKQYPLLIFLHGIGESGNGSAAQLPYVLRNGPPKLINQGTFPVSFTVNGQTFSFIVISPQFSDWPQPADVDAVVTYAMTNYRVDPKRVYLTGLSMGGGATWEYPGSTTVPYAAKLAAIVPICGASSPSMYRAQQIIKYLLPVWATHNLNDPTASVQLTIGYIDSLNKARDIAISKNVTVGPAPKMTIFNASGHDAWTQTYDPSYRENNMNVYEWMLSYVKNPNAPADTPPNANAGPDRTITLPTNSVGLTGSNSSDADGTIKSYSWTRTAGPTQFTISNAAVSNPTVSNLVAGTYTFRLTVTDNMGAIGFDDVNVIVNSGTTNISPVANAGADKTITLPTNSVVLTGSGSDADGTIKSYSWSETAGPTQFTFSSTTVSNPTVSNLVAGTYTFKLTVTDNLGATGSDNVNVVVNSAAVNTLPVANAGADQTITLPANSVILAGSGTDADGTIKSYSWSETAGPTQFTFSSTTVSNPTVSNLVAGTYTFKLTVTDNLGATGSDNINVVVNPAAVTGGDGKTIKVNVYGGSNPYSDPQWNNWAMSTGAATNISSTAFKYSNGSASTIVANLSQSTAIADNGTEYALTGAIAPAGVLRYASYSTTGRTLTISGLSTSKKYDMELYASRNLNSGNTTDFVTGGKTDSVSTYNNLTNKAVFTSLVPDAQGRVVINISETATYNYINGFTLTEDTVANASKYVKVNVYGGANPYNDPQWNNWALSTGSATNTTSTAFKYSDGSASALVANLSQSAAIADNGTSYALTGAMAPAGVLRYASYSTVSRTLSISGLSVSKKYDLELYASRNANSGNSTKYAINSLSTSIATFDDLTNKAVFSGLQPDAQGRIIISITTGTGVYNYINGFMITEGSSATTASVNDSPVQMMSGQVTSEEQSQSSIEEEGKILRIWPNPVHDAFTLELSDEQRGNLQVQVIDITGAVRRTFNIVKDQNHITQTFSVAGLATGTYILRVQNSSWAGVIKMIKL